MEIGKHGQNGVLVHCIVVKEDNHDIVHAPTQFLNLVVTFVLEKPAKKDCVNSLNAVIMLFKIIQE